MKHLCVYNLLYVTSDDKLYMAVRTTGKGVEFVSSHVLGPQLSLGRGDQMILHILDTEHYPGTGMGEYTPYNTYGYSRMICDMGF